jgi:hypothetical protein
MKMGSGFRVMADRQPDGVHMKLRQGCESVVIHRHHTRIISLDRGGEMSDAGRDK